MRKITLIGAGLVGSYLAARLSQYDYSVEIFEKRADPRIEKADVGRSINLALSTRGIRALEKIQLHHIVLQHAVPMYGRYIHDVNIKQMIQLYGLTDTDCIYSISRRDLNIHLLNALNTQKVKINFSSRLINIDNDAQKICLYDETKKEEILKNFDVLISCDGAFSMSRQLMKKNNQMDFSQKTLLHGYKELIIPSAKGKILKNNYLHVWPRKKFMLIALPNFDGSFTCTLFLALKGKNSFENLKKKSDVEYFFQKYFSDVLALVPNIPSQFFYHPVGRLNSIKCNSWYYRNALLMGDAVHAMSPFFGQGMNCSFEDCCLLLSYLEKNQHDWSKTFSDFSQARKIDTDAVTDMSYENYREMRDDVINPKFQLQKKLENILMKKYPAVFLPKYNMVTFATIPYHQISYLANIQQKFFDTLLKDVESIEEIDWKQVEEFMQQYQSLNKQIPHLF